MPIATRCGFLLLLTVLSVGSALSQQADTLSADTVNIGPFNAYWTKPRLVPKVGFGVQQTGYGELGVQLHQIYVHPLSLASAGPYLTADAVFQPEDIIVGPKLGYEFTAGLLGLAADVTYYTDFDKHTWMATPKAGLTLFGYVNVFYGYNLYLSDNMFGSLSHNRLGLNFNLDPDYHHIHEAAKKRRRSRHQQ